MTDRVTTLAMQTVRFERGSRRLQPTDRVAIVASFGPDNTVSRSLVTFTQELEANGYTVIIVRASDDARPLRWPTDNVAHPIIVRKANIGYDFGSWAVGLELFPSVRRKPFVILTNDSLLGPFSSLTPLIENFESCSTNVWGATNTSQMHAHLQSFFVGYRSGILSNPALKQFWSDLRIEADKGMIIQKYELGLSRLLFAEGLTTSACFESERVVSDSENPTIEGWKNLLRLGFPFVKKELITNPAIVPSATDIPATVRAQFGTDPREWL
ncbi:rhamnan synthesis F family protein [Cryobacterium glaciale]|uniref:rhamnan synthesis F family protein n=1 Tax=Cryobacterium glaciale TaxID=1259145 RepID=UPI00141B7C5D|nr:rhamnan synthesis F family protein [Cryobacterium glaciale]